MFDKLNLVFPMPEIREVKSDMAREQAARPHPADEIIPQTGYWHKDLAHYFLVQFGTF